MSRKCRKLQLRALVGRFGSQNAMVGRLDDLRAGGVSVCPVGHRNEEKILFTGLSCQLFEIKVIIWCLFVIVPSCL